VGKVEFFSTSEKCPKKLKCVKKLEFVDTNFVRFSANEKLI